MALSHLLYRAIVLQDFIIEGNKIEYACTIPYNYTIMSKYKVQFKKKTSVLSD
jgi:hypothetical protein